MHTLAYKVGDRMKSEICLVVGIWKFYILNSKFVKLHQ